MKNRIDTYPCAEPEELWMGHEDHDEANSCTIGEERSKMERQSYQANLRKNGRQSAFQGLLLLNKPRGKTSFSLVHALRKITGVRKIGHAGTLDPFATGVMVMLIGREYTRLSDQFLNHDKEYVARVRLGITTDTYDCDGETTATSDHIPQEIILPQGTILQTPPMYSAKKVNGKKLYELARQGKTIEREPVQVAVETHLLSYEYPYLDIRVSCSKGTYIRSIAHDLGVQLGCGAHLTHLERIRSGPFHINDCLKEIPEDVTPYLKTDTSLILSNHGNHSRDCALSGH